MVTSVDEISENALALDEDLRIDPAERLVDSTRQSTAVNAEQLAILHRRAAEIESGSVEPIPADEAFEKMSETLLKKRRNA